MLIYVAIPSKYDVYMDLVFEWFQSGIDFWSFLSFYNTCIVL